MLWGNNMDKKTMQYNLANNLKYLAFENSLRYVDISKKSDIGQNSLYGYNQMIGIISHDKAIRLADTLGIPLENLCRCIKKSNMTFRIRLTLEKKSTISDESIRQILMMLATPFFDYTYRLIMGKEFENSNKINLETLSVYIVDPLEEGKLAIELRSIGVSTLSNDLKPSSIELVNFIARLLGPHIKDIKYRIIYT